jgi:hypothetical protein
LKFWWFFDQLEGFSEGKLDERKLEKSIVGTDHLKSKKPTTFIIKPQIRHYLNRATSVSLPHPDC